MSKKCQTPGCQDSAVSLGFCTPCYQFHRYWNYRSLADKVAHNDKMKRQAKRKRGQILFIQSKRRNVA